MRKRVPLFVLAFAGLLSSCSIWDLVNGGGIIVPTGGETISTETLTKKTLDVYDLKKYAEENPASNDLSAFQRDPLNVYYPQGKEDVLYVTFDEYCEQLSTHFAMGYSHKVTGSASAPIWNVSQGDKLVYQLKTDLSSFAFSVGGSLYGADAMTKTYNRSSLLIGMDNTQDVMEIGDVYTTHSFSFFKTPIVRNGSTYYFPLALLEEEIGRAFGSWHFHDFSRLYRYDDRDQLALTFTLQGKEMTAETGIKEYMATHASMPEGLRKLDADVIYYIFNNEYGLLAQRGYASGTKALDSLGVYDRLISANTATRQKALYEAFALFDDDHTGIYPTHGEMWGENRDGYVRGAKSVARTHTRQTLAEQREAWLQNLGKEPTDVLYHQDMAYFSFDGFAFAENAYVGDTQTLRDDLYTEDTFYYFLHQFEAIEEHKGIQRVLIDVSLNGGGVVGILYKLMALLSPSNSSRLSFMRSDTGAKYAITTQVDVNGDGKYEADETYGGKYEFYVLTSDASFSCGNAFPFALRKQGFAKTVGTNSGGGECTVDSSFLPSGHGVVFSSTNHIGYTSKGSSVFFGDEVGAGVDIALATSSFYDLGALYAAITK